MKQWIKCLINAHEYEIHETKEVKNVRGEVVAAAYISRCKHCGKITVKNVTISSNF